MPSLQRWLSIAFGGGRFVAVEPNYTYAAVSVDGMSWTQHQIPNTASWSGIAYGNGTFVAVGPEKTFVDVNNSESVATSPDGITWTTRTVPVRNGNFLCVAYGGGTFVAIGYTTNKAATSTDTGAPAFANISGATSASLALTGLTSTNNGDQYRAVVSAANAASVTSNAATLTVN
jgi:hypothetical protein